ncbi:MAG: hypothetical protein ACP5IO_05840 [Elusimicrobiales bacterium]
MKKTVVFSIFFLISQVLNSQQLKILKPKEIKFATPFSLIIEIDSKYSIISVSTSSIAQSDFEFIGMKIKNSKLILDTIAFNVGISTFPSLAINTHLNTEIKTPALALEIKPLYNPKETDQIRDIAPIFSFLWWLKIVITILLILLGWLAYRKFRKKTPHPQNITYKDMRTPYERAMDSMRDLISKNLVEQNRIKEFYFELSDIIRKYIEEEFNVCATQMTSNELVRKLKNEFSVEIIIKLKEFLEISDLVKFAKYIPEIERINKNIQEANDIIKKMDEFSKEKKIKQEEKIESEAIKKEKR